MFIRIACPNERRELLLNLENISKIEVEYYVRRKDGDLYQVSLDDGINDASAVRCYKVYVGDEILKLMANPNDPAVIAIDEIYQSSIPISRLDWWH